MQAIFPRTPQSGQSFEVAFTSAIVYIKKARSLAGSVMNYQGGLEVAAVKSGLCT